MTKRSPLRPDIRRQVAKRADYLCEYCLIHEQDTILGCAADHIISLKHGGSNELDNLAYACVYCNRFKGSDIGSIVWESGEFIRFFHPRQDRWHEHFRLTGARIESITAIAQVTIRILALNDSDRLDERRLLIQIGRYPTDIAQQRMGRPKP